MIFTSVRDAANRHYESLATSRVRVREFSFMHNRVIKISSYRNNEDNVRGLCMHAAAAVSFSAFS